MRRIALFVEGQTEAIFVKRLLKEIARDHAIVFQETKLGSGPLVLSNESQQIQQKYYALICDCGNDDAVKSRMIESSATMIAHNYTRIVGVRDLRPLENQELRKLQRGLNRGLNDHGIPMDVIVAVREIEAWFIEEWKHFQNIHPRLTRSRIRNRLGFDIDATRASTIEEPAEFLHSAYQIFGKRYRKTKKQIQTTVRALDFEHLYVDVRPKVPELSRLLGLLDSFI